MKQETALEIKIDAEAELVERENRFLARVRILNDESDTEAHVHDPGRLKELLWSGNRLLLRKVVNPKRKTQWDVIAAKFESEWILIHSGYHRKIAHWLLTSQHCPFEDVTGIRAEVKYLDSRLDFFIAHSRGKQTALEIKGCTLAEDGVALFPDAPTVRGARHLKTLIAATQNNLNAAAILLVFRPDARIFRPFVLRDPHFAEVFRSALNQGVSIRAFVFRFDGKAVRFVREIPVEG